MIQIVFHWTGAAEGMILQQGDAFMHRNSINRYLC